MQSPLGKTRTLETVLGLFLRLPGILLITGLIFVPVALILWLIELFFLLVEFNAVGTLLSFAYKCVLLIWVLFAIWLALRTVLGLQEDKTQKALGARPPSQREKIMLLDAISRIATLQMQGHSNFWVIDYPQPKAWTIGEDLYITRFAITSEYLPAILAHEIAHLNNGDGKTIKTLRNFVYSFMSYRTTGIGNLTGYQERQAVDQQDVVRVFDETIQKLLFAAVFGGFGAIWYREEWAEYFRSRDVLADEKVVEMGLRGDLLKYLEAHKDLSLAVPFSLNWEEFTEIRIDRLLNPTTTTP